MKVPGALLALAFSGAVAAAPPAVTATQVFAGLSLPVEIAHAGDGSGRLFIAQQGGLIRIRSGGTTLPTPFLDVSGIISTGGERGLLGLAFHPGYVANGAFYVFYTRSGDGALVVARYLRSAADADRADSASGVPILVVPHSTADNHNGGKIAFGPDGHLYVGTGDGGGGGDPLRAGQSNATLLGKILRIAVDGGGAYSIPAGNPFAASTCAAGSCPEILHYGLRNPWRFSFDALTGDLYIGDVGQGNWEEVDFLPAGTPPGRNLGWGIFEANACYNDDYYTPGGGACAALANHFPPVIAYGHVASGGYSITGGYVYRGRQSAALRGWYLYADYGTRRIWAARQSAGSWDVGVVVAPLPEVASISTFGVDEAGEIFFADYGNGAIWRLAGPPPAYYPQGDFDGDGRRDLLWRDTGDGSVQAWLMNGLAVSGIAGLLPAGGGYTVTHVADLDGDGLSDLLIRHSDGTVIAWLMNGLAVSGQATLAPAGSGYTIVKVGDLNGDGKDDLLWQHTDGSVQAWLMDGLAATSMATFVGAGSGWSPSHLADISGDGKADILWQHSDGSVQAWIMNGLAVSGVASLAPAGSGWSIALTGDFNADGKTDLVWQHTDGRTQAWLMNGLAVTGVASFTPAAAGWTPVLAGDVDGDGKADLFWQHTSGASQTWLMNGLAVSNIASFVGAGAWSATHLLDVNGDGKRDVFWRNADGSVQGWLLNGLTVTSIVSLAPAGSYLMIPPAP